MRSQQQQAKDALAAAATSNAALTAQVASLQDQIVTLGEHATQQARAKSEALQSVRKLEATVEELRVQLGVDRDAITKLTADRDNLHSRVTSMEV